MPSAAKLAANRANAQRSTGPKSEAGKQAAKFNATRHGLAGKQVVVKGEDPAAYEALRADLMAAYKPVDTAEELLVEEIAQNYWRLQRARSIEAETFNIAGAGADPVIGLHAGAREFETVRRYMASIERAYHRAIALLQNLQRHRFTRPQAGGLPPKPQPVPGFPASKVFVMPAADSPAAITAKMHRQHVDTPLLS